MEIAELFRLEVDMNNHKSDDPKLKENRLLSMENVLKTMAREYFTMVGTLSSSLRGSEILEKFKIFKELIELSELPGRDDLCNLIMTSLDYNIQGNSRVILAKALTSTSKVVRYLATRHMKVLLRAGVQDFATWGIEFLVKQLSDSDTKVANLALTILDEACDEADCMDSLIATRPSSLNTSEQARNLFLRFLSRPEGFKLLSELGFIRDELKRWKRIQNVAYVAALESTLAEIFYPSFYKQRESGQSGDTVSLPPHFFGELAKTHEGCELLEKSKCISKFFKTIRSRSKEPIKRRAALWALGHIATSQTGFRLFDETKVNILVELAENCTCLSIRGTCFYVLGMISRVEKGRELLNLLNWESPSNLNSGVSVPKDIKSNHFFKLSPCQYEGSFASSVSIFSLGERPEIHKEILLNVANLSNTISAESASRALKRMKSQNSEYFSSPAVIADVFQLLSIYKYRLQVRRFIYEMFDIQWTEEALAVLDAHSYFTCAPATSSTAMITA